MENREESTAEIADKIREFFDDGPDDIVAVYLFGSVARAEAGRRSDVDVGVLLASPPPPTLDGLLLDVEGELEKHLERPVDLVVLNTAPVDLIHRVLRDGRVVIDRRPPTRFAFEVLSRNRYFDLKPILRQYRARGESRS